MSPESVISIGRHALEVTLMLSLPVLLTGLAIGLVVGIFQAATQINEATLSFIPKLVGIAMMLMMIGSWMLKVISNYTRELIMSIPGLLN
jgi:flagellar biosynthesis protein FliQ